MQDAPGPTRRSPAGPPAPAVPGCPRAARTSTPSSAWAARRSIAATASARVRAAARTPATGICVAARSSAASSSAVPGSGHRVRRRAAPASSPSTATSPDAVASAGVASCPSRGPGTSTTWPAVSTNTRSPLSPARSGAAGLTASASTAAPTSTACWTVSPASAIRRLSRTPSTRQGTVGSIGCLGRPAREPDLGCSSRLNRSIRTSVIRTPPPTAARLTWPPRNDQVLSPCSVPAGRTSRRSGATRRSDGIVMVSRRLARRPTDRDTAPNASAPNRKAITCGSCSAIRGRRSLIKSPRATATKLARRSWRRSSAPWRVCSRSRRSTGWRAVRRECRSAATHVRWRSAQRHCRLREPLGPLDRSGIESVPIAVARQATGRPGRGDGCRFRCCSDLARVPRFPVSTGRRAGGAGPRGKCPPDT